MSKPKTKNDIGTIARTVGVNVPGTLLRAPSRHAWKVLDSRELLRSLHNIKDKAVEEHTRNNLQALIDQVYGMELDV